MKVGLNYGCANGGMMDSMDVAPMEDPDNEGWKPEYVLEVTEAEWKEWEAFLLLHDKWDSFWTKKTREAEKRRRK